MQLSPFLSATLYIGGLLFVCGNPCVGCSQTQYTGKSTFLQTGGHFILSNINILTGKVLADFKTFVKFMLPATPEKTDQEKAIELLQKVLVSHASK